MNFDPTDLQSKARNIRRNILTMLHAAGSGHTAGALSITDVLTYLYFVEMHVNPTDPDMTERDRFVLSPAHMVPGLYATLSEAGFFPAEELLTLRKFGSRLEGHTTRNLDIGVETTGGSLAQGESLALGFAQAARIGGHKYRTYCITSDGESNEGQTWEAAMFAAKYKLDNLVFILDHNEIQLSGASPDIMPHENLSERWRAFNWNVIAINGHDFLEIASALRTAREMKEKPTIIIANTTAGKGVSFMEGKWQWHGKVPNSEELKLALAELA